MHCYVLLNNESLSPRLSCDVIALYYYGSDVTGVTHEYLVILYGSRYHLDIMAWKLVFYDKQGHYIQL